MVYDRDTFMMMIRGNKKMKPLKNISLELKNFDDFQMGIKNDGMMNAKDLIELREFIDSTLMLLGQSVYKFIRYHKDSPNYWGTVDKNEYEDEVEYNLSIDLESCIPEEEKAERKQTTKESYIPDNYELAEKVLKEFKKVKPKNTIEDNSYRDCASFVSKNKKELEELSKFLDKKYIQPKLKEIMEFFEIKDIHFEGSKFEVIYE